VRAAGLQGLKRRLAPPLFRAYVGGLRLPPLDAPDRAVIFACLHRDILPAIAYVRPTRPVLLVSRSSDGEILVDCLADRGFDVVRGSTGAQGGEAFRQLLAHLRAGRPLGLAVDGPRGPFAMVHEGVLQLARLGEVPIRPVIVRPGADLQLRNWDRTRLPLPFSRPRVRLGAPLPIARDATGEDLAATGEHLREILLGGEATA